MSDFRTHDRMVRPPDSLQAALAPRYVLRHEIGRGGMAIVYLADDLELQRPVAVKVLRSQLAETLIATRFEREIRIAAQLTHPNIVSIFEGGSAGGHLYYVMPFITGGSLADRLKRETRLALDDAVAITCQVASALGYAHDRGVIHRDIKPGNIMFSGGQPQVADFGIARAVTEAGGDRLTEPSLVLGTPEYMSPEQASGAPEVDSRTDLYSLGCVLYEMLSGQPPFLGDTHQATMVLQLTGTPPPLERVRPEIPEKLRVAVATALAKKPADRFAKASDMVESLAEGTDPALAGPGSPAERRRRRRRPLWAIVATLVVTVVLFGLGTWAIRRWISNDGLDPNLYLAGSQFGDELADPELERLLDHHFKAALRQVPDLRLLDEFIVTGWLQEAGRPSNLSGWRRGARDHGAGQIVLLSARRLGDAAEIVAARYDAAGPRLPESRQDARTRIHRASTEGIAKATARLVESLFDLRALAISPVVSESDEATRAFVAGFSTLGDWNLALAEARLNEAVERDPDYARANFWLAQVRAWAQESGATWVGLAQRAAEAGERAFADGREASLARALRHMGEGAFAEACHEYRRVVSEDSANFVAWFGLGECQARDEIVLPDVESRSGFRYRSSYHSATQAYTEALRLVTGFAFAFGREYPSRLERIFYPLERNRLRAGHALPPDTAIFSAYASFGDDTVGFIPWPHAEVLKPEPWAVPETTAEAVAANRRRLLDFVQHWADAFPDRFEPNRAVASALELQHSLDPQVGASALEYTERARGLVQAPEDSLDVELLQLRLLLKVERFREAKRVADGLLSRWAADPDPARARRLAGVAALTGDAHLAANLARRAAPAIKADEPRLGDITPTVLAERQALIAYAAIGAPEDSLHRLMPRLEALIETHEEPAEIARYACRWLGVPRRLAYHVLEEPVDDPTCWSDPHLEVLWALKHGEMARFRELVDGLRASRHDMRPGDLSIDGTYQESWVLLAAGDTARAIEQLDRSLGALRGLGTDLVAQLPQAVGLVRAMALRAELAWARGDYETARRWAEPVVDLWSDAEVLELREVVQRMDQIREGIGSTENSRL